MENQFSIDGNIIDVVSRTTFPGTVVVKSGKIEKIKTGNSNSGFFICPGLIDAHVHIESSMLTPVEFARMAVNHGTVATVSDPHEIANVLGKVGVRFMIESGNKTIFKFLFVNIFFKILVYAIKKANKIGLIIKLSIFSPNYLNSLL